MNKEMKEFIQPIEERTISKDLEEEYQRFLKIEWFDNPGKYTMSEFCALIAHHFAEWQERRDNICYEEIFEEGATWKYNELLKNTTERVVHIDEDSCPFIRRNELTYDIKTQVPGVKEGEKVRVMIIKKNQNNEDNN